MTLDLHQDESIAAIADSVRRHCSSLAGPTNASAIWPGLAELGLFALPQLFGPVACLAMVAAMEALGRAGIGGPIADTLTFSACAPQDMVDEVASGVTIACLGRPPLVPWPGTPAVHVTEHAGQAVLLEIASADPVDMLDPEGWARVTAAPGQPLGPFDPWHDRYDLAVAAWLVGAGHDLVEAAGRHAAQRVQFGRAIGDFQAVSAPLARAVASLDGAKLLVEAAAIELDAGDARLVTVARRAAARAAEAGAVTSHQTYGAFGVLEAGPVFPRSRRIRQLAPQFPSERPVELAALGRGSLGLVGGPSAGDAQ